MTPVSNKRVLFNEVPEGYPDPKRTVTIDNSIIDLAKEPLNGGILVKVLSLSIDPYLRELMRSESLWSGTSFKVGEPLFSIGVSKVVRSENPQFSAEDHLYGIHPFVEYVVLKDLDGYKKIENNAGLPWYLYLGVCGMPGRTAYYGYKEFVQPYAKKGDTIFVTTGAGPVGSLVIQLAKLDRLKVIASAGSEDKVRFMQECGADISFNYKASEMKGVLSKHGPINFYWDNVGGSALDDALEACAQFARIVICGHISGYNDQPTPVYNTRHVLWKSLSIDGFLVGHLEQKYDTDFWNFVPPKIAKDELKHREDVRCGLESVGQALYDVQTGKNTGKTVVVPADD